MTQKQYADEMMKLRIQACKAGLSPIEIIGTAAMELAVITVGLAPPGELIARAGAVAELYITAVKNTADLNEVRK